MIRNVRDVRVAGGPCEHEEWRAGDPVACGATCLDGAVILETPAGRPPVVAGPYCPKHGGGERARRQAEGDWNYLAPASVGDARAVVAAGCMHLGTRDAYVVVRPHGRIWRAWLGLGDAQIGVMRPGCQGYERGRFAHGTKNAAIEAGLAEWRKYVDDHVDRIREARGGTLAWGDPIEPLDAPVVLILGETGDAVAKARRVPKTAPDTPKARLAGVRASGEVT